LFSWFGGVHGAFLAQRKQFLAAAGTGLMNGFLFFHMFYCEELVAGDE
jgi:hypothetical protein